MSAAGFSTGCCDCPRLSQHLADVRELHPDYHARPVAPFGAEAPRLMIVGLAPGLHGANRTGRPFTGDYAGILLYDTLHRFGYGNRAVSVALGDGLELSECRITNAVKCLPPQNKPEPSEVRQCNRYLKDELATLDESAAILALGAIAHQAVLMALGLRRAEFPFAHGAQHPLPGGPPFSTAITAAATTPTRAGSPNRCSTRYSRASDASCLAHDRFR